MILSVIMPVYNTEKFLPRCLDSLLRQGLKAGEYEIICVNDGSTDRSAAILAEYEEKHPDIFRVITQEKKSMSHARNAGTALARGEYVGYVDSDDYVTDGAYRYLLEHFCQDKPDVLCFNYSTVYTDGKALHDPAAKPDGQVTFDGDGTDAYNRLSLPFVWSKFYKRSFLERHGITGKPVFCEDEVFNFDIFRHHPHTRIVSSNVCRYEQGNTSSTMRLQAKRQVLRQFEDLFLNMNEMDAYLRHGDGELAPAARRNINNFLNVYHKKLIMVFLTWGEWHAFRQRMKAFPAYEPVPSSDTRAARWLGQVKKWSGSSYLFYLLIYFMRNVIFFRLIRPFMLRKNTAGPD